MPQKPVTKYRKDYTPPSHLIERVDLHFDLYEDRTLVRSTLKLKSNPKSISQKGVLKLDGKEQKLLSIQMDGKVLSQKDYNLDEESLTLRGVPQNFDLVIESEIKPQNNTALTGLYKSNNSFCTQCEAEDFRKITYYLDRPDVLSLFKTTIVADKQKYPILLSNGNIIDQGDLDDGRHFVTWEDPFKKPCYLFALVAGSFDCLEDHFVTQSDRRVQLKIFSNKGKKDKCHTAMEALKKAMRWDEETYGREYDLDIFMIVAVNDFNFGAMENKGLNIFNDKYILADPETASDQDYANIDAVVAHEYFHNWTGNRITCRDWFQLSLKEGLTVFRDQSFSADIGSAAVTRIDEVRGLRAAQFPEDNGPLAHPVRPDSYMEMNNFYTSTVYEKGAEVIRMMHTLLGPVKYRKAMDLYFQRYDGQAVTCDDFVQTMEGAGGIDLSQFKRWYSQAGTPELTITSDYNQQEKELQVTVHQRTKATPDQNKKLPLHIPLSIGLFSGHEEVESRILHIKEEKQSFSFKDIQEKPVLSLLRGFSAPVKLNYDYTDNDLAFLMAHDTDDIVRWEAGQLYAIRQLQALIKAHQENKSFSIDEGFMTSFKKVLINQELDKSLITLMLVLPSENYLADSMDEIDIDAIHHSRQWMRQEILKGFKEDLLKVYYDNQSTKPYRFVVEEVARRSLKNICLQYLSLEAEKENYSFILQQFEKANNMTDKMAALNALSHIDCPERLKALGAFYQQWQTEPLVLDKWFRVQATSSLPKTLSYVQKLTEHPAFSLKNPNKVYNLLGAFAGGNPVRFHDPSGLGYSFLADYVIKLNKTNPQVASRLVQPLTKWQRHDSNRKRLMKSQLERILKEPKISKGLYEIVTKGLK